MAFNASLDLAAATRCSTADASARSSSRCESVLGHDERLCDTPAAGEEAARDNSTGARNSRNLEPLESQNSGLAQTLEILTIFHYVWFGAACEWLGTTEGFLFGGAASVFAVSVLICGWLWTGEKELWDLFFRRRRRPKQKVLPNAWPQTIGALKPKWR